MKHNAELSSFPTANKLLKFAIIGLIACLGLLCLYYGCSFGPGSRRSDEEASGSDGLHPLFGGFVLHPHLGDLHDDQEHNSEVLKSLPICDLRFSELIPCLDRNLIYQLRLKPNLTLREHYERHCPRPERRYNCLIPPPLGYKIPIRWPASRDEVWKANIPHTLLAQVKSDQNWMVVNGDKINFPGGGTHFHDGADKCIVALSRTRVERIGIIGREEVINWGLSGPMLQASRTQWDLRKVDHYECYGEFDWEVQWQKEGDSLARYLVRIGEMIESMLKFPGDKFNNGGNIRNVLDVGCGVASFGAYLLSHDVIALSLAPNDAHENQIQFALERGIPSTLGILGIKRLTYPSRSFELAHCSRCRIDWLQRDGILLLELDRLLRPGGYFVYTSPEAYAHDPENRRIWNAMYDLLKRMCWRVAAKKDPSVVWAKPLTNSCYLKRDSRTQPPLCGSKDDPDASWNVSMKACISRYSGKMHKERGSGLAPWPQRLTAAPPRLEEIGVSPEEFQEDTYIWRFRVIEYWKQMKSVIQENSIRNVMDMNSYLGGFAAALNEKDVWVMNVAPVNASARLKIIYDRGLIGTVHDWCEAFSTYPRTYDLLHAWEVFSEIYERGCNAEDLLIEMDRILRPDGFVIIRDKPAVINYIRKFLTALKWDGWLSEVEPRVDALSSSDERVLIARKKLWDEGLSVM